MRAGARGRIGRWAGLVERAMHARMVSMHGCSGLGTRLGTAAASGSACQLQVLPCGACQVSGSPPWHLQHQGAMDHGCAHRLRPSYIQLRSTMMMMVVALTCFRCGSMCPYMLHAPLERAYMCSTCAPRLPPRQRLWKGQMQRPLSMQHDYTQAGRGRPASRELDQAGKQRSSCRSRHASSASAPRTAPQPGPRPRHAKSLTVAGRGHV